MVGVLQVKPDASVMYASSSNLSKSYPFEIAMAKQQWTVVILAAGPNVSL